MSVKTMISREIASLLLEAPSGARPRMYGQVTEESEILAIRSQYDLDRFPDVSIIWVSTITYSDLISQA